MKNKYPEIAAIREPTVRVTRSRAAACSSGEVIISDMSKQKPDLRKNSKRAALDERNNLVCVGVRNQHKRRAVLKDVTNVFCNNSSKICSNAVKELKKSSNQAKKGSKVAPCVVGKIQHSPSSETGQKTVMVESQVGEVLWPLDKKAQLETSSKSAEKCCIMDIRQCNATQHFRHSQRFSKKEKENCLYEKKTCREPEFTDIDSHHKDPQLCSHYASDIYNNLRVAELILKPCFNSMEIVQREITRGMRGILVDWLVEVCEEYKLVPDTLYLTVHLIDLFLSRYFIERQRLQLLGITCLLIASKYEEICAPHVEDFCFITDNTYTKIEVLTMESKVLKDLCFRISAPTAKTFLRRFLRAAQVSYKSPSLELEYLANYLAELTLVDYSFQKFRPSIIAASAVLLARWTLNQSSHPWNPTLEHYTNYKASDLKITVLELQSLQLNSGGCPLNAIRTKYRQAKFKCVAGLPSPKLKETVFSNMEVEH